MDAITLLKEDHKNVRKLFRQFEKAGGGAKARQRQIVDKIIEELSMHAAIEEQLFYPTVRAAVERTEDMVLESLEEHHAVKWVLSELEDMDPGEERFKAKVTVLIENVEHHAKEEETDLFPQVRKAMSRRDLAELGELMAKAKKTAPTRPHPRMPDTPPGNIVGGAAAGIIDKARSAGKRATKAAATRKSTRGRSRSTSTGTRSTGTRSTGRSRSGARG